MHSKQYKQLQKGKHLAHFYEILNISNEKKTIVGRYIVNFQSASPLKLWHHRFSNLSITLP